MKIKKVLIVRFSSFGDIIQCTPVVDIIRREYPSAQIDWLTKSEFEKLLMLQSEINHIWSFDKKLGMKGLIGLAFKLRSENYDHIYDAHNNVRSLVLSFFLRTRLSSSPHWISRSKERIKRFLLFQCRLNLFPKPFKGIHSYLKPLEEWGLKNTNVILKANWKFQNVPTLTKKDIFLNEKTVILVPSAAWEMKRWPLDYWKKLVVIMPEYQFVVLGGSNDHFCEEIRHIDPHRVTNLAGKLSLEESCLVVNDSHLVISADTGLLHVADVLGKKAISLMGPTAFGFTTGPQISTLEVELSCRPCSKDGRGKCSQDIYQKCMVGISPEMVASEVHRLLHENSFSSPTTND